MKKRVKNHDRRLSMRDKRVVFMGTPEYSIPVLKMLIENTNVVGVVTQPDKEVGRKRVLTECPVKKLAKESNIKVLTPRKLREEYKDIIDLNPDIIITCAYGQILPEELIYAPLYNTVNVHASLLPKYRGGAPIHHAIINGEKETGITIMYTDKGMDSGPIIALRKINIGENDTYDIISQKMSNLGAVLLKEVLEDIFANKVPRIKQNADDKTIAPIIKKEDEHLDFNQNARDVHNKIRGLSSVPGAYAVINGSRMKILLSRETFQKAKGVPGTITKIDKDCIYVSCLDNEIMLTRIQIPGKKPMEVKDYINGIKKEDLLNKMFS